MAITLSLPNKAYLGTGLVLLTYNFTAGASGDTLSVTVTGPRPIEANFTDANGNQIVSSPPTFGSWTTTGDQSTATLTANSGGGGVTNGTMLLLCGGS